MYNLQFWPLHGGHMYHYNFESSTPITMISIKLLVKIQGEKKKERKQNIVWLNSDHDF